MGDGCQAFYGGVRFQVGVSIRVEVQVSRGELVDKARCDGPTTLKIRALPAFLADSRFPVDGATTEAAVSSMVADSASRLQKKIKSCDAEQNE